MSHRNDPHRPGVLDPAGYTFIAYQEVSDDGGPVEWASDDASDLYGNAGVFNPDGEGCDVCGHGYLIHRYTFLHRPTNELVTVGADCAVKLDLATRDELDLRAAAHRRKLTAIRDRWFAIDPDRLVAYEWAKADGSEFADKFVARVQRDGMTSDRFTRAIVRSMARAERIERERAAERAAASPVVTGDGIAIDGEVVKAYWKDNPYAYNGDRHVMIVRDDRGFKVWGSVPAALEDVEAGDRVRFVANIAASDDDNTFGFFKRPRKAELVEAVAA